MKHLEQKWVLRRFEGHFVVITSGESNWNIAQVANYLWEDDDGKKTAQYICDLHNAELKRKAGK